MTRWHSLSGSFVAYSAVGIDQWAIYSPLLKSRLGITQGQLETIGVAGSLVNLVGLSSVPGLLADKYGPRLAVTGSFFLYGGGLWLFWATLAGVLPSHPSTIVFQLSACKVISGWGSEWPSAGLLPLTVKNFPDAATKALASFKCMVSLSGAIVTIIYQGFIATSAHDQQSAWGGSSSSSASMEESGSSSLGHEDSLAPLHFLLCIAIAAPSMSLLGLPFLR